MGGEHGPGGQQVPDYAGKEGGHSGGPGGHARERLDELIAQRVPASEDAADGEAADGGHTDAEPTDSEPTDSEPTDAECEPDEAPASERPEQETEDSGEDHPHEEGAGP